MSAPVHLMVRDETITTRRAHLPHYACGVELDAVSLQTSIRHFVTCPGCVASIMAEVNATLRARAHEVHP